MTLIEKLIEDAKAAPSRRVALPECETEKTLLAARCVLDEGVGTPVLVSPREVIEATAQAAGVSIDGMEIVDTADEAAADALAERYMAGGARLLSAKGTRRKIKAPMWYAMVMEELGDVDCTFCGHTNTTGDVLMAAQTIIGLKEGVDVPSIFALVETDGFAGPEGSVICFADCGLNPEPTASDLASIAISAADNVASIMGWEPRVGFLSYSTCGSGAGSSVDRVNEAIALVHERRPDIAADGGRCQHLRLRRGGETELPRRYHGETAQRRLERRHADRSRIDPVQQMGHHRIARHGDPADFPRFRRQLPQQRIDRLRGNSALQGGRAPRRSGGGNPVDHVVAETRLTVQSAGGGDDVPIMQQQRGHRRGADIHRRGPSAPRRGTLQRQQNTGLHRHLFAQQRMERNPDRPALSGRAAVAAAHCARPAFPAVIPVAAGDKHAVEKFDQTVAAAAGSAAAQIEPPAVPGERRAQRLFRLRDDVPPFRSACHL